MPESQMSELPHRFHGSRAQGRLVVCTKDRRMPQPKRKIRLLSCTGGAVGRTRQHERLDDPSSKQSDPSSSASPSCIMHHGQRRWGVARNDCHVQTLTNSHRSSSSSAFLIKRQPLALSSCHLHKLCHRTCSCVLPNMFPEAPIRV